MYSVYVIEISDERGLRLNPSGRVNTPPPTRLHIDEGVGCVLVLGLIWPSLDHSWITHSRKRTVPRGHRRIRRPRHSSSGGPQRSRQDTRGHGADTVRDREDEGSNPSPPTIFVFKIGDFEGSSGSSAHSRITVSRRTIAIPASVGDRYRRI